MWATKKFYAEQMKVKIARLKILTFHNCCSINEIESELKYVQNLEKA